MMVVLTIVTLMSIVALWHLFDFFHCAFQIKEDLQVGNIDDGFKPCDLDLNCGIVAFVWLFRSNQICKLVTMMVVLTINTLILTVAASPPTTEVVLSKQGGNVTRSLYHRWNHRSILSGFSTQSWQHFIRFIIWSGFEELTSALIYGLKV